MGNEKSGGEAHLNDSDQGVGVSNSQKRDGGRQRERAVARGSIFRLLAVLRGISRGDLGDASGLDTRDILLFHVTNDGDSLDGVEQAGLRLRGHRTHGMGRLQLPAGRAQTMSRAVSFLERSGIPARARSGGT